MGNHQWYEYDRWSIFPLLNPVLCSWRGTCDSLYLLQRAEVAPEGLSCTQKVRKPFQPHVHLFKVQNSKTDIDLSYGSWRMKNCTHFFFFSFFFFFFFLCNDSFENALFKAQCSPRHRDLVLKYSSPNQEHYELVTSYNFYNTWHQGDIFHFYNNGPFHST